MLQVGLQADSISPLNKADLTVKRPSQTLA